MSDTQHTLLSDDEFLRSLDAGAFLKEKYFPNPTSSLAPYWDIIVEALKKYADLKTAPLQSRIKELEERNKFLTNGFEMVWEAYIKTLSAKDLKLLIEKLEESRAKETI